MKILSTGSEAPTVALVVRPSQPEVVRRRLKALRNEGGVTWSLDGLLLVAILVAVAAVGGILLHHAHRRSKEARRKARSVPRRTSYAPSKPPPGRGRFEIRDGDPEPAVLAGAEALSSLKPGAPVLVLGERPGSELLEAHVQDVDGRRVRVMLCASARLTSEQVFVCRRRRDGEMLLYPLEVDTEETSGSVVSASLGRGSPVIKLQTAGALPAQLPAVVLLDEEDGETEPDEALALPLQVTGLGLGRVWVSDGDDLPEDQPLLLRCVLPGEDGSAEFTVRRRVSRADHANRSVVELLIERGALPDRARLARCLALQVQAGIDLKGRAPEPIGV